MEDTLRVETWVKKEDTATVLILVLMEDTLREREFFGHPFTFKSLNPCFNGRYSQRQHNFCAHTGEIVLILVLMEDTLRVGYKSSIPSISRS